MKYIYLLLTFSFFIISNANCQTIQRQIIGSTGKDFAANGIILKTSVGEPIIGKTGNTSLTLSQGFFTGSVDGVTYLYDNKVKEPAIQIFPNPSVGNIVLGGNISSLKRIEIYNGTGQRVYSEVYSSNNINLNQLSAGLYIINFLGSNNEIQSSSKFIKVVQ